MKDTGTRENRSRSGRVRSHRPTGAMAMTGRARKDRKIKNYPEKRVMIG